MDDRRTIAFLVVLHRKCYNYSKMNTYPLMEDTYAEQNKNYWKFYQVH